MQQACDGKLNLTYAPTSTSNESSSAILASTLSDLPSKVSRPRAKENPSCTWRSRQPQWRNAADAMDRSKYWNDSTYAAFYETSAQERQTMMESRDGAGLSPLGTAKLAASWRRHGFPAPSSSMSRKAHSKGERIGNSMMSEQKAAQFQQAFASLSRGHQSIWKSQSLELFQALGAPLAPTALEKLLDETSSQSEVSDKLTYDEAFHLYEQVLFPGVGRNVVSDALEDFVQEVIDSSVASTVDDRLGRLYQPREKNISKGSPHIAGAKKEQLHIVPKDEQFASIYRLPPRSSPRAQSILKKIGRFTVSPSDA